MIGYLASGSPGPSAPSVGAFRQGLSETGYIEGKDVAVEYRWAEGSYDRLPAMAANLVDLKVDVIVASGNIAPLAAKNATLAIPIVFAGGDPVAAGLVTSLARPGGNLTGFSLFVGELMPQASRAAFRSGSPGQVDCPARKSENVRVPSAQYEICRKRRALRGCS